jgi:hypothetical protein
MRVRRVDSLHCSDTTDMETSRGFVEPLTLRMVSNVRKTNSFPRICFWPHR